MILSPLVHFQTIVADKTATPKHVYDAWCAIADDLDILEKHACINLYLQRIHLASEELDEAMTQDLLQGLHTNKTPLSTVLGLNATLHCTDEDVFDEEEKSELQTEWNNMSAMLDTKHYRQWLQEEIDALSGLGHRFCLSEETQKLVNAAFAFAMLEVHRNCPRPLKTWKHMTYEDQIVLANDIVYCTYMNVGLPVPPLRHANEIGTPYIEPGLESEYDGDGDFTYAAPTLAGTIALKPLILTEGVSVHIEDDFKKWSLEVALATTMLALQAAADEKMLSPDDCAVLSLWQKSMQAAETWQALRDNDRVPLPQDDYDMQVKLNASLAEALHAGPSWRACRVAHRMFDPVDTKLRAREEAVFNQIEYGRDLSGQAKKRVNRNTLNSGPYGVGMN